MFTLYQFSRTWVDSSRIYAIRRQILKLKCTKFDFRWGSAPDPLAGFKAPTSKGREAKMERRGRMESGGGNEGPTTTKAERRKWIGGREGKRKGFAGPMSKCFLRPWFLFCLVYASWWIMIFTYYVQTQHRTVTRARLPWRLAPSRLKDLAVSGRRSSPWWWSVVKARRWSVLQDLAVSSRYWT